MGVPSYNHIMRCAVNVWPTNPIGRLLISQTRPMEAHRLHANNSINGPNPGTTCTLDGQHVLHNVSDLPESDALDGLQWVTVLIWRHHDLPDDTSQVNFEMKRRDDTHPDTHRVSSYQYNTILR